MSGVAATLGCVVGVFERLAGQAELVDELRSAALGARDIARSGFAAADDSRMTHAWLFTGPPGSGRSVAARCFAAALQCEDPAGPGCGHCRACTTAMAGTHADVRIVAPEGLSIGVEAMREIVARASSRPVTGDWQVVIVEDADRLTEGAANALLKVVEEPPSQTVFLLCAPTTDPADIMITLRSRSRHVYVRTPSIGSVAKLLASEPGVDAETARWAASVSGGHIGRGRRLATDADSRARRAAVLRLPAAMSSPAHAYAAGEELVAAAEKESARIGSELDERETEELRTALGAGGTGKGAAAAQRGSAGALKALERRQKSRSTRNRRDALDLALIDLAGFYRDALMFSLGVEVVPLHGDMEEQTRGYGAAHTPESLLRGMDAILEARRAIDFNVKPRVAIDAMVAALVLAGESGRRPR